MRTGRPPSITTKFLAGPVRPAAPRSPATLPPTSSPTREYRQHHVVEEPRVDSEAFHPAFRVKSRLIGLAEAGRIDRFQLEIAIEFRRWCETIGKLPVQTWEVRVQRSLFGTPSPLQATAAAQLRDADAALGPDRMRLLDLCLVEDANWNEIGKRIGLSDKTAIGRVVEAIAALSLWSRGLPVPDPPPARFRNQPRSW